MLLVLCFSKLKKRQITSSSGYEEFRRSQTGSFSSLERFFQAYFFFLPLLLRHKVNSRDDKQQSQEGYCPAAHHAGAAEAHHPHHAAEAQSASGVEQRQRATDNLNPSEHLFVHSFHLSILLFSVKTI